MTVYLPLEIKHRELPSRLLIAAHLVEAGKQVFIGNHWALAANLGVLPPGVVMFKTVNKIQGQNMAAAKQAGHVVVAVDEEVLIFTDHFTLAFSPLAAENCDVFLAQSPAHKNEVEQEFPGLNVQVAGNPRLDLMIPENRWMFADPAVQSCKPFILFNTNYASINSVWNRDGRVNMAVAEETGAFEGDRQKKEKELLEFLQWEQQNFEAMVALLRWTISNVKGINIVIRPHPAEKPGLWNALCGNAPNVRIVNDSNPHPWIFGAELLVHTGCTTGLEAVLLGRPVLNLAPTDRPNYGQITPLVNPTVRTPTAAAEAMVAFLGKKAGPIVAHNAVPALKEHLPGYASGTAALAIARFLASHSTTGDWRGSFADVSRTDLQRQKFTASEADIRSGFKSARKAAGVRGPYEIAQVGDSLFRLSSTS